MDVAPSSKTTEDVQALRAHLAAEIGQDILERSGDAFKVENGLIRGEWGETFYLLLGNYHPCKAEELAGGREITTYHKTNLSQNPVSSVLRSVWSGSKARLLEELGEVPRQSSNPLQSRHHIPFVRRRTETGDASGEGLEENKWLHSGEPVLVR